MDVQRFYKVKLSGIFLISLVIGISPQINAETNVEIAGDILQISLPTIAFGMTYAYKDPQGRTQFYKSFFSTLGTTYALKLIVEKERPDGGDMSFPSGHTSAAFSGASFMQQRYGWQYGAPAYSAAILVGLSRVESEAHYIEDVIAGATIGIAYTYIFTAPYNSNIRVIPNINKDRYSVSIHFLF